MINLEIIKKIESDGDPRAYNTRSQASGLYQITPIVLRDFKEFVPFLNWKPAAMQKLTTLTVDDLFDPNINKLIAEWYLTIRIPQMLEHYKKPVTNRNILISYNAGIAYVVNDKPLPLETVNYLKKYQALGGNL